MKVFSTISAMYCFLLVNGTSISVKGPEGGEVSFWCSHKLAQNNDKYFCIDPCKSDEHILAKVKPGGVKVSERVQLQDHKDGSFTVTMSHLKTSDKGNYWCAVDRLLDTYTPVHLNVTEGLSYKTTTNISAITEVTITLENKLITHSTILTDGSTNSSPGRNTEETATTRTLQTEKEKYSRLVLYLIVGVLVVFTVTIVVVLCFRKCKQKTRHREQVCSIPQQLISSDLNQVSARNDNTPEPAIQPVYVNISCSKPTRNTASSTISRHDHFPSYVQPLPALPEKDSVEMCGARANAETCARAEQSSLWFGLIHPQT